MRSLIEIEWRIEEFAEKIEGTQYLRVLQKPVLYMKANYKAERVAGSLPFLMEIVDPQWEPVPTVLKEWVE